ncbi:MAG: NAD(P)-dependent oxidoreductase [Pseudomonadota bacterium]
MTVLCFEMTSWEADMLQRNCPNTVLKPTKKRLTADNAGQFQDAEMLSSFVYSNLSRDVLEQMPDLKFIAARSTGYDHIDLDYCRQHDITVCNVPSYGTKTVAEHAFALLLSLSRNIPNAARGTREGRFNFDGLCGFDLCDKTIGVIGTGDIGGHTVRIANGFDMEVLGYDLYPNADLPCTYTDLDDLLGRADIISLNIPGSAETKDFLSDREFGLMKDGIVIINTARGTVVNNAALLKNLDSGKVAGAGLDVLAGERALHDRDVLFSPDFSSRYDPWSLLIDQALMHHPNTLITPHSGFYTHEALGRILETTAENICGFLVDKPRNIVT